MGTGTQQEGYVLLVEDHAPTREALTEVLEEAGMTVVSTANGCEALVYLRAHPRPRVIVLDLRMPVMNGWAFRAEQLQDAALRSIPVIVLSAEEVPALDALQPQGFLRKPVEIPLLLALLATYCPDSPP